MSYGCCAYDSGFVSLFVDSSFDTSPFLASDFYPFALFFPLGSCFFSCLQLPAYNSSGHLAGLEFIFLIRVRALNVRSTL